jgi:hypothetical protein
MKGNPEKFDCELAGRIIRVHLNHRYIRRFRLDFDV